VFTAARIHNLSVRYGSVTALDQINLEIPAGVSVAIIGPNGSGKSTLLKAMAGLVRSTTGSIDRSGSVAIVLQATDVDPSVPLTVGDTVAMARYPNIGLLGRLGPADRKAIAGAVATLDLKDLTGRQIHQLSGGQRQRTFVAQGLAQGADVLLLDEPFIGLDVVSRSLITEALAKERAAGRTVILTTHSFAEAEQADLVVLLATGCVAFGTPEQVLTELNLRRAFGDSFIRVGETLVLDDPHHEHEHDHHHVH
jgi:manganese transport system ATP-binding protein